MYKFYSKYYSAFTKKLVNILKSGAPFPKIEFKEQSIDHKSINKEIDDNVIVFCFKKLLPKTVQRKFYFEGKVEYG